MGTHQTHWDHYVKAELAKRQNGHGHRSHPGDEWASRDRWQLLFDELFRRAGVSGWRRAAEIGAGSGKYTALAFEAAPELEILSFDVSKEFISVCEARFASGDTKGRFHPVHIPGETANELLLEIEARGWRRKLDAVFSIDAMVHVDLQYLSAYLLTAALTLRQGGSLVLTLADATNDHGFDHLLRGIKRHYPLQGDPGIKFEFLSPDIVGSVLTRLGFRISVLDQWSPAGFGTGRDLHVVAELEQLDRAECFEWALIGRKGNLDQRLAVAADAPPPLLSWDAANGQESTFEVVRDATDAEPIHAWSIRYPWFSLPDNAWALVPEGGRFDWRVVDGENGMDDPIASGTVLRGARGAPHDATGRSS